MRGKPIQADGEESGFEASGPEQGLLAKDHAFEGEQFLGVDGLVDVDEVGFQIGDGLEVSQANDAEVGGGEAVAARAFGRSGRRWRDWPRVAGQGRGVSGGAFSRRTSSLPSGLRDTTEKLDFRVRVASGDRKLRIYLFGTAGNG
jgi:hypothetical protein